MKKKREKKPKHFNLPKMIRAAAAPIVASASRSSSSPASSSSSSSPFLATRRHRVLAAAVTTVTGLVAAGYQKRIGFFPSLFSPHSSRPPSIAARAMTSSSSSASAAASILEGAKPHPTHPRPTTVGPRSSPPPTALVFLMHGLGDTAAGWSDVAQMLSPALPHARFVLPTAATQPVSLNGGMPMPSWYDIHSLESIAGREDPTGLARSLAYVEGLVRAEMEASEVPAARVVVAGFSQGGAVALGMLRSDLALGGVMALSSYLPLVAPGSPHAASAVSSANEGAKVFFGHGDADAVVQFGFGAASAEFLRKRGLEVEFKTYRGMGHSARDDELADIAAFLKERLPPV